VTYRRKKLTFAISSPDEFLSPLGTGLLGTLALPLGLLFLVTLCRPEVSQLKRPPNTSQL